MVEESKASLFPDILNSARSSGGHNNSNGNGTITYDIPDDFNNLMVENHQSSIASEVKLNLDEEESKMIVEQQSIIE